MDCDTDTLNESVGKRRKIANPSGWKKNLNKKMREEGEQYSSVSKNVICQKPSRQLIEACASSFCKKSAFRNCSEFSEPIRKDIFSLFWDMSWDQQHLYVVRLASFIEKKKSCSENSRRVQSVAYFLRHNSRRLQVCRQMFFSTLGLKEKMVRNWINIGGKHGTQLSPEKFSSHRIELKRSTAAGQHNQQRRTYLQKWLAELPKMESHNCRKNTKKLYFEADFSTYQEIYKLYVVYCESNKENGNMKLSYPIFAEKIKNSNYSIFKPKKDECDVCIAHKHNNVSSEIYEKHRDAIAKMREQKYNDVRNAASGLCALFCMDMQALKLVPQLNANAAYYKMKQQVHNFTIYNIVTHESNNYVWDETEGNLVASSFVTCIIKHLKNFHARSPETHHIIIYSDGCFWNVTIEQKYLISGHTQMECDATHSLIERKMNKKQIYLPSRFVQVIREARKTPSPLQVHQLHYHDFLDFESIPKRYMSIRPGRSIGDHTVNMLRALAYDPSDLLYFKTNISDAYTILPQRSNTVIQHINPSSLHRVKIAVSKKKWDHLQDLKKFLPADTYHFYDDLPYEI